MQSNTGVSKLIHVIVGNIGENGYTLEKICNTSLTK